MIFLFLFLTKAFACDNLRIQQLGNVDLTSNLNHAETFRVRRNGDDGCNFFVTVNNGGASSYVVRRLLHDNNADTLPVQICLDANCNGIIKHFPQISSSGDIISGSFPDGDNDPQFYDFTIYPRLGNLDYQKFGRYEDDFTMRVYEGTFGGSNSQEDAEGFRVRYDMSQKIDLSLVNTGSAFDASSTSKSLNFGILYTNQQMGFDLVVKYNAGYRIRFSSLNNGNLKIFSGSNTIPYTLTMAGNPVNLVGSSGNPVQVAQGSGVSIAGGLRSAGLFTIGTVAPTQQAGNYSDTITVTVTTTE